MAFLQLPYNLSELFEFDKTDMNEGSMESSTEDFFDSFEFMPETEPTINYLARGGERIQSLLRIKTHRIYSMDDFFKLFSGEQFWKKSMKRQDFIEYLTKTYCKKVVEPAMDILCKELLSNQITEEEASSRLQVLFGFSLSASCCRDFLVQKLVCAAGVRCDCILKLTVFQEEVFLVFGKLKTKHRNRHIWIKSDKKDCILWDAYYISKFALMERIRIEYQRYIDSIKSKENDLIYMSILEEITKHYWIDGRLYTVHVYEKERDQFPEVMKLLEQLNVPVKTRIQGQTAGGILFHRSQLELILPVLHQYPISKIDIHPYAGFPEGYLIIIKALMERYKMKENERRYHRNNTAVANAFMTKKHIPPKHQNYMKENSFLKVYHYVEVDADCDLDKMRELEKELIALGTILGEETYDAKIRFRKLGRHHASGLYSPGHCCVCIDIRSPSSYVHEFLHMYDHFHGMLSEGYDFKEIRLQYEACLKESLSNCENPALKAQLTGNSKYNLDYYLVPTEIFARCGELYFTRFRGVDNSLLKFERGFDYPENEKLMELIKKYFDHHFLLEEAEES